MPSEDINNLFTRFGSRSGRYHEIVRDEQTQESIGRWPLLSHVEVNEVRDIPGVLALPLARFSTARAEPAPILAAVQGVSQALPGVSPTAPAASPLRSELRMVPSQPVPGRPGGSLRSLFGRLSAPVQPTAASPRPQPAFRRLRHS